MEYNLKEIFESFTPEGTYLAGEPYGSGHIHDTFQVETKEKDKDNSKEEAGLCLRRKSESVAAPSGGAPSSPTRSTISASPSSASPAKGREGR